jgi:hypothetical protein
MEGKASIAEETSQPNRNTWRLENDKNKQESKQTTTMKRPEAHALQYKKK